MPLKVDLTTSRLGWQALCLQSSFVAALLVPPISILHGGQQRTIVARAQVVDLEDFEDLESRLKGKWMKMAIKRTNMP